MAEDFFRGPIVSVGSMMNFTANIDAFDGPSIGYQNWATPDPRQSPMDKNGLGQARIRSYFNTMDVVAVDTIPSANGTANIAAAQAPSTTAGVALTLVTAVLGTAAGVPVFTPGIPIVVAATTGMPTSTVTTVSAIDFGFATGTTATNSSTVIVNDNTNFAVGQWIVIGGAGSGSLTNVALFTQVQSISTNNNSALITISPVAATTLVHAPIGQGNLYNKFLPPGTQFGPATASANAAEPYWAAGLARLFDPLAGSARALAVSAASIGSGTTALTVNGYDIYGVPMTELITCDGTTVVNGKKAFKYINNIQVAVAATTVTPANVQVGISDIFGLPLRSNRWEQLSIYWNGCSANTSVGWTAALATASLTSTVDVRGTVNASTLSVATVASTNGGRRLTILMSLPASNVINATPLNAKSLYGTAQV